MCLIARSISDMHPRAGVGRCPVRMMLAVAGDGSGPIVGDEERANKRMKVNANQRERLKKLTKRAHMPLYLLNEIPNLRATFRLLKTQRIVNPIWLSPHNQGVCSSL